MSVLVTGACGFVMSVMIQRLLAMRPDIQIIAIDLAAPDQRLRLALGESIERVDFRQLDLQNADALADIVTTMRPDVVVHAATLTHVPAWERQDPARYIDVNIGGTLNLLEACRSAPSVTRLVHVSSGAVYGAGEGIDNPVAETAPLQANELYGISKVSSEMMVHRYGALSDWQTPTLRLTKIFGEMERPTSARASMSLPFHLAAAAVSGEPVRLTERTLQAGGDWLSAIDVAAALIPLCVAENTRSGTWNLAGGQWTSVTELISLFGASFEIIAPSDTSSAGAGAGSIGDTVDIVPTLRSGKDGVLDIESARSELGWSPRPLSLQVNEYLDWAGDNAAFFS